MDDQDRKKLLDAAMRADPRLQQEEFRIKTTQNHFNVTEDQARTIDKMGQCIADAMVPLVVSGKLNPDEFRGFMQHVHGTMHDHFGFGKVDFPKGPPAEYTPPEQRDGSVKPTVH